MSCHVKRKRGICDTPDMANEVKSQVGSVFTFYFNAMRDKFFFLLMDSTIAGRILPEVGELEAWLKGRTLTAWDVLEAYRKAHPQKWVRFWDEMVGTIEAKPSE